MDRSQDAPHILRDFVIIFKSSPTPASISLGGRESTAPPMSSQVRQPRWVVAAQFFLFVFNVLFAFLTDMPFVGHRGLDERYVVPPDFHGAASVWGFASVGRGRVSPPGRAPRACYKSLK